MTQRTPFYERPVAMLAVLIAIVVVIGVIVVFCAMLVPGTTNT